MTAEQLIEKIKHGENETFELKADVRDPILLAKLIGSFANRNGGQIVVGVREPIEVVGIDINRLQNIFERTISALSPVPNVSTDVIRVDSKNVFVIDVQKSSEIIFSAGSVYQRTGEQIIPMSADEINQKLTNLSSDYHSLETLATAIERQSKIIDELREEIRNSNSWKSKMRDNFVSGLIGALLGLALTLLLTK